jgi:hypothetical protein
MPSAHRCSSTDHHLPAVAKDRNTSGQAQHKCNSCSSARTLCPLQGPSSVLRHTIGLTPGAPDQTRPATYITPAGRRACPCALHCPAWPSFKAGLGDTHTLERRICRSHCMYLCTTPAHDTSRTQDQEWTACTPITRWHSPKAAPVRDSGYIVCPNSIPCRTTSCSPTRQSRAHLQRPPWQCTVARASSCPTICRCHNSLSMPPDRIPATPAYDPGRTIDRKQTVRTPVKWWHSPRAAPAPKLSYHKPPPATATPTAPR